MTDQDADGIGDECDTCWRQQMPSRRTTTQMEREIRAITALRWPIPCKKMGTRMTLETFATAIGTTMASPTKRTTALRKKTTARLMVMAMGWAMLVIRSDGSNTDQQDTDGDGVGDAATMITMWTVTNGTTPSITAQMFPTRTKPTLMKTVLSRLRCR